MVGVAKEGVRDDQKANDTMIQEEIPQTWSRRFAASVSGTLERTRGIERPSKGNCVS